MSKFRKKPVEIEAVQFIDINSIGAASFSDVPEWLDQSIIRGDVFIALGPQGPELNIATMEGNHLAAPGDMIIQGVKGELYPCKPDIFALTYDPVDDHAKRELAAAIDVLENGRG